MNKLNRTEVTIRALRNEDADAVAQLSTQLGYPVSQQEARKRVDSLINSTGHQVYVAETADGSVVGWIHVFTTLRLESEKFAEIGGLIVSAEYRRQGIGSLLLRHAERWTLDRGLKLIRIRSRSGRMQAHRFFQNFGFQQTKTQFIFGKLLEEAP